MIETALTRKQQGFVRDYISTGNATLAVRRNYSIKNDSTVRAIGSENLAKPNIRRSIQEALEASGITNELLAQRIAELVNAQSKVTYLKHGEVEMIREVMDSQAVKAGLEFAFKFKEKAVEEEKQMNPSSERDKLAEELEVLRIRLNNSRTPLPPR